MVFARKLQFSLRGIVADLVILHYRINKNMMSLHDGVLRARYCCVHTGHRAKDMQRPANGKTCRNCGKVVNFATVCRSRPKPANNANYTPPSQNQAFQVSEHDTAYLFYSDDDECIFRVQQFPTLPTINITVDGVCPCCYRFWCNCKRCRY